MLTNLAKYESCIKDAVSHGVQIIVFPEDGLYGADFPDRDRIKPYLQTLPEIGAVACGDSTADPITHKISCLAATYKLYLVLDMATRVGDAQYNTAVAFGRRGELLAVYHKTHLYYEPQFDAGNGTAAFFDTDFGVRVGLFVCFDIMFPQPMTDLFHAGVSHIAYPTDWVNFPPLITATQTQAAFAAATGTALLAANIGSGWFGGGSGIYVGDRVLDTYLNLSYPDAHMQLADVPVLLPRPQTHYTHPLTRASSGAQSVPTVVPFETPGHGSLTAENNGITCSAQWETDPSSPKATYALVAFNGTYNDLFEANICAVLACPVNGTCGDATFEASAVFHALSVCKLSSDEAWVQYHLAARDGGDVLSPSLYHATDSCMQLHGQAVGEDAASPLLNFAIFARVST